MKLLKNQILVELDFSNICFIITILILGIHAREWISPSVSTYIAKSLVEEGNDLLDHLNMIIIPVANPDGYEYSHLNDRLWRKNMRVINGSECIGVDLNRNWDHNWGVNDAGHDPCSNIYVGSQPFSEPESNAIANLVTALRKDVSILGIL